MVTNADVRLWALALPESEEHPHWEATSFRTRKKIFATFEEEKRVATLKLPLGDQEAVTTLQPEVFSLGGWSHQGWTRVDLTRVDPGEFRSLLTLAWRQIATKRAIKAFEARIE